MTDLYEVMRCAPSTRYFTDEPVPKETLHRVLDNARFAPSGGNRQGWRVIVITDRDTRRQLRELYEPAWVEYTKQMGVRAMLDAGERPESVPAGPVEDAEGRRRVRPHLRRGPGPPRPVRRHRRARDRQTVSLERPSIVGGASVYPFVQNVLLGLRAEGLGAAFTTLLAPAEPQVQELLGIPDGIAVAGHISVGHRADPWPAKLSRKPVGEFAFAERYGNAW